MAPRRGSAVRVAATLGVSAALALALAGCESYQPRPVDLAAYDVAWKGRLVSAASVREFLERHDETSRDDVTSLDVTDGVTLHEAQLLAAAFNPRLRIARLEVERARAGASHAGAWSDPNLSLTFLDINENVPDPRAIFGVLTMAVPLSDRLEAAVALADSEQRVAALRLVEQEWATRDDLRRAWVAWTAAGARAAEAEALLSQLDDLVAIADRLAARGELPRTEVASFALERARLADRLELERGERDVRAARIRTLIGLAPTSDVTFVPSFDVRAADDPVTDDALRDRNPTLARLHAEYARAEAVVRAEVEAQIPDLVIGPQVEVDGGQSRIGVTGSSNLPVFDGNRRAIAEARASRLIAGATLEAEYERLVGQTAETATRAVALARRLDTARSSLVPLVDRHLTDVLRRIEIGEGEVALLLDAVTRAHDVKLDLIDLREQHELARSQLSHLLGPPATEPTDTEDVP